MVKLILLDEPKNTVTIGHNKKEALRSGRALTKRAAFGNLTRL
jgi:hypothetical protein